MHAPEDVVLNEQPARLVGDENIGIGLARRVEIPVGEIAVADFAPVREETP